MESARFDAATRSFARFTTRRRLLGRLGLGGLAAAAIGGRPQPTAARTTASTTQELSCSCSCARKGCCYRNDNGDFMCSTDDSCWVCSNLAPGVVGGGAVRLASGEAALALAVSARLADDGAPTGQGFGLVTWTDPGANLELTSIGIDRYGPVGDLEGVREISGLAMVNGEGSYSFVLRVLVSPLDDSVRDTISLTVNDDIGGSGFSYAADGNLVSGDLVGTWTVPVPPDAITLEGEATPAA
jgi:hypothetical protein